MTPKHFYLLLLAFIAVRNALGQGLDELPIPLENDNQFPPDNHSDVTEGSGEGFIEEPAETTTKIYLAPALEQIESKIQPNDIGDTEHNDAEGCSTPCLCLFEGADFKVDCSGHDLTEFPSLINENVTILDIQNNKITEIPKTISSLKKLKVINAYNNAIMNLDLGSISELPALVTLKLANNKLTNYPADLKNSFGLTQLEELDLGGNDIITPLDAEMFSMFVSLQTITLPSGTDNLVQSLCSSSENNLSRVCIESCDAKLYECQDELPVLPGMLVPSFDDEDSDTTNSPADSTTISVEAAGADISFRSGIMKQANDNAAISPADETPTEVLSNTDNILLPILPGMQIPSFDDKNTAGTTNSPVDTNTKSVGASEAEFSFRSAVIKQANDEIVGSISGDTPTEVSSSTEITVKTGATTSDKTTGGVDKTIIGLVVVGMVVVVAAITVKKNWSSIKKRFGSNSNSRTPNERVAGNSNGAAPEEVPLQDKSPV